MSATDSDNSIDWLASDNEEDNDSEREPDCAGRQSQTEASSSHLGCEEEERGEWSEVREASGGESPSSGLCETRLRGLKRPRHLTEEEEEEEEEEELISSMSEKDRVFSRKCLELQCYIQPLSSILRGLRSGRYRERLSSFQESVAMDRIQRIMGVLQNPCMGEKYINIILKMEEMLKSWFPNVKLHEPAAVAHAEHGLPTKKLKLSPPAAVTASDPSPGAKSLRVTDLTPPGVYCASNLKWLHTSPICSPTAEQARPSSPCHAAPAPPPTDTQLTQDNAVSSSTDTKTEPPPRGPLPPPPPRPLGKINAPCLERLLKSTESIITRKGSAALTDSSWS